MADLTASKRGIQDCVRCGICKSNCPTYLETSKESYSSRGRIALINEFNESNTTDTKASERLSDRIFSCILCGSCNNICPLKIDITEAVYQIRSHLNTTTRKTSFAVTIIRHLFRRPELIFYALKASNNLSRYLTFIKKGHMRDLLDMKLQAPHMPLSRTVTLSSPRSYIGRAAIFPGCTVNYIFPRIGLALVEILNALGYEAVILRSQLCCGAPYLSMGMRQDAKAQAEANLDAFRGLSIDRIISLCPTCVYTMRDSYRSLIGRRLENIEDSTEFIFSHWEALMSICGDLRFVYAGSALKYHHPCHTRNYMNPKRVIPDILRTLGLDITEDDSCCGFGGSFRFLQREISTSMLSKLEKNYSMSDMVITSCPNCIIQFKGSKINSRHFIEIINAAIRR